MFVSHSGQTAGYKAEMLYCPDLELGITILSNERSIKTGILAYRIFDLYNGKAIPAESDAAEADPFVSFDAELAACFAGGYIVEGLGAKVALNVEESYIHGAFLGLGEDFFIQ